MRATTETTDRDLVAAVRRGDDRAFERLYERYHRRIAAYIYGMVNDYGRAEDIAQDVFMSALRRMRETDRPIAFKPWIYEIAKNACIDQFRRSRRAEEVSYDADSGLGASDYGRLVTTGPTPDAAVDNKMSLDHLCGAFGGLSDTHHEILVMRELEGLSYREIGERLNMTRPSVESTLFRARRRLSEEYEDLVSGERCTRVQGIIATASEGALGTRDQRKLAKHVAHCQSCRRQARLAGLDAAVVAQRPTRARIAAFLPLPAFLKRRFEQDDAGLGNATAGHAPMVAQWSAQLSATVDPAIASWAKAAVAAAAVAIAGVGAGAATNDERLDLQGTLPANAVQKDVARDAAVRVPQRPTAAKAVTPAGTRHVAASAPVVAGADRARAQRDGGALKGSSSGGSSGGTATSAAPPTDNVPNLVPGLAPQGDGTDAPTGNGRPGQKQDPVQQAVDTAESLAPPTAGGGVPTAGPDTNRVGDTVTTTADAVTGVINP